MNRGQRPSEHECFDYHRDYVAYVPDGDIVETLAEQKTQIATFIASLHEDVAGVVHPPYSWSVRQVIEHCADAERVFGYRLLRFAAGDATELPGWNENNFAACGYGPHSTLAELGEEYVATRQSNLGLLTRLADDAWNSLGTADGRKVSARTIAWLLAGHWLHHFQILQKRLAD